MKRLRAIAWILVNSVLVACSSSGGDGPAADDTGGSDDTSVGDTATSDASPSETTGDTPAGECSTSDDCTKKMGTLTPTGCAVATCSPTTHKCAYKAADVDGDGHGLHACTTSTGVTVDLGDDCDDTNKDVYPGRAADCCDGSKWTGAPTAVGACHCGTKACQTDGTFAACTGVVNPAARDCKSSLDNDCDGKGDVSECTCTSGTSDSCGTALGAKGACAKGTTTCTCDTTDCATAHWGPCSVTPAAADTCDACAASGLCDANCDGTPNGGCACINGTSASCGTALGKKGACAAGTTICAAGAYGPCSISPAGADTCDLNNDSNCDGTVNEGCKCINGTTGPCGNPHVELTSYVQACTDNSGTCTGAGCICKMSGGSCNGATSCTGGTSVGQCNGPNCTCSGTGVRCISGTTCTCSGGTCTTGSAYGSCYGTTLSCAGTGCSISSIYGGTCTTTGATGSCKDYCTCSGSTCTLSPSGGRWAAGTSCPGPTGACTQGKETCSFGAWPCGTTGAGPWCSSASYCPTYACPQFWGDAKTAYTDSTSFPLTVSCPAGTHLVDCTGSSTYCSVFRSGSSCTVTVNSGYATTHNLCGGTPICQGDGP